MRCGGECDRRVVSLPVIRNQFDSYRESFRSWNTCPKAKTATTAANNHCAATASPIAPTLADSNPTLVHRIADRIWDGVMTQILTPVDATRGV
jgi:hypothetical protein